MTTDSLTESFEIGQKDRVVFDWPNVESVLEKVTEELNELKQSLAEGRLAQAHELGDVLFTLAQVGRHLNINPEMALATANQRYLKRFETMQNLVLQDKKKFKELNLTQLEEYWQKAKKSLKPQELKVLETRFGRF